MSIYYLTFKIVLYPAVNVSRLEMFQFIFFTLNGDSCSILISIECK